MNEAQFKILAAAMKASWASPNFLPDKESRAVWYRMLSDLPYEIAEAAIYKLMASSKFPPSIAEVREAAACFTPNEQRDWLEGWSMLQKAIGRYGMYRTQEALESLRAKDPLTARTAEMLGWHNLCMSENLTADRANFRQCYEACTKREAENAKLPPMVKKLLSSVSNKLLLTEGEENGQKKSYLEHQGQQKQKIEAYIIEALPRLF